jgi:hypothetical protein
VEGTKPTGEEPISRQEADDGYRKMRALVIFSDLWFLALAGVCAALDFAGWPFLLGAAVASSVALTPIALHIIRRDLDKRVRVGEEALGKVSAPPREPLG